MRNFRVFQDLNLYNEWHKTSDLSYWLKNSSHQIYSGRIAVQCSCKCVRESFSCRAAIQLLKYFQFPSYSVGGPL